MAFVKMFAFPKLAPAWVIPVDQLVTVAAVRWTVAPVRADMRAPATNAFQCVFPKLAPAWVIFAGTKAMVAGGY